MINIHKLLIASSKNPEKFFNDAEKIIHKYKLSHSYKKDIVPDSLKKEFKKTLSTEQLCDYNKIEETVIASLAYTKTRIYNQCLADKNTPLKPT